MMVLLFRGSGSDSVTSSGMIFRVEGNLTKNAHLIMLKTAAKARRNLMMKVGYES